MKQKKLRSISKKKFIKFICKLMAIIYFSRGKIVSDAPKINFHIIIIIIISPYKNSSLKISSFSGLGKSDLCQYCQVIY